MITKDNKKLKIRIVIAVVITIALLSTLFYKTAFVNFVNFNFETTNYENNLYVNFIDVGQGKAIAIRLDDGKSVLIDCGSNYERTKFFNYFNNKFITSNVNNYLDYLVLTHTDNDHIGNAVELLQKYEVKNIYLPTYCQTHLDNNTYDNELGVTTEFVCAIKNENANIQYSLYNKEIVCEDYKFTFLAPISTTYSEVNDYSSVIKLEYANKSFLFTGDISADVEEDLVSLYNNNELKVDVLDIAHHGSKYSTCDLFLQEVQPQYAVISVGENNYDQPHEDVLLRLNDNGVENENIYITKELGSVVFNVKIDGEITINNVKYVYGLKTNFEWWQIFTALEVLSIVLIFSFTKFGRSEQRYKN